MPADGLMAHTHRVSVMAGPVNTERRLRYRRVFAVTSRITSSRPETLDDGPSVARVVPRDSVRARGEREQLWIEMSVSSVGEARPSPLLLLTTTRAIPSVRAREVADAANEPHHRRHSYCVVWSPSGLTPGHAQSMETLVLRVVRDSPAGHARRRPLEVGPARPASVGEARPSPLLLLTSHRRDPAGWCPRDRRCRARRASHTDATLPLLYCGLSGLRRRTTRERRGVRLRVARAHLRIIRDVPLDDAHHASGVGGRGSADAASATSRAPTRRIALMHVRSSSGDGESRPPAPAGPPS